MGAVEGSCSRRSPLRLVGVSRSVMLDPGVDEQICVFGLILCNDASNFADGCDMVVSVVGRRWEKVGR
jgi:hypothetical protein